MATSVVGAAPEFDGDTSEWEIYTERLAHYFAANGIEAAEKKRAILFTVCGTATYKLMKNLVAPADISTKTFAQLVQLVQVHYHPKPSAIVMRFRFNSCTRQSGESVAAFVARLRELAQSCDYGDSLEDMLRDRIVCGIQDERLQRSLLAVANLTFKTAFEKAQVFESAEANARALGARSAPGPLQVAWTPQDGQDRAAPAACYRCGGQHLASRCRFRDAKCNRCGKKGHIARVCRSAKQPDLPAPSERSQGQSRYQRANLLSEEREVTSTPEPQQFTVDYSMFQVVTQPVDRVAPIQVEMAINGANLLMEVDTGAALTLISATTYQKLWPQPNTPKLHKVSVSLRTYTGEQLKILGRCMVTVEYGGQVADLGLVVVEGHGPSLLGRDWLEKIRLNWGTLHSINHSTKSLEDALSAHKALFRDELGTVKGVTAKIHVDPTARPRFYKARTVPYALRGKVEAALDSLQKEGIIEPVSYSEWAAPVVPIVKKDGTIRLCGDYKVTVNRVIEPDSYPLPRIEDLFACLTGGETFSKLDLRQAYQQLVMEEESKAYLTINTHKGLFRYNRLPFGVSSAPAIFQRTMESILGGLPHVCIYLDDILVTGHSEAEHLRNLEAVLSRLEEAGVRLKRSKCAFMLPEVEYLGHRISGKGLQPTAEKVVEAPTPTSVTQLKSYLGLLSYYCKFLPDLATRLAPLYVLLQKHKKWSWGREPETAFQNSKKLLTESSLLTHYDPQKELLLACDASPYGVGAVLSHRMPDGTDRPVAFASRSLSPAERKYSQLDKEALGIVFGIKRFHHYLYGRKFTILSDHQPLQYLFDESRCVPTLASARIQRWALMLSAYDYHIAYKPGSMNANADGLSRLPLPDSPSAVPVPGELVLLFECLQHSPLKAAQIRTWTDKDPVLSRVRDRVLSGWRDTNEPEMKPYQNRSSELSVQDGCLLLGSRVIVPKQGRAQVREQLHESHPGIARMKGLARGYVWWPGMDKELEDKVKSCQKCQEHQKLPAAAPLHPWEWPSRPWERIHVDYAGPFMGRMFLVLVDAHSKWLHVDIVGTANSQSTIEKLRATFATHGLPETMVTDNGSVFTSTEFKEFCSGNGIHHITSSPYHPASNGLAERAVQTFKTVMKKSTSGSLESRVSRFLFNYRLTPHSTTGTSPAEMLLGRRPRSLLDLLHPDKTATVRKHQLRQKET